MALKLTSIGIAIVMIVAGSFASVASGSPLTSDGPVLLDGTDFLNSSAFTAFGERISCTDSSYQGAAVGGGAISSGATTVTLTPTYNNAACSTSGGLKATVAMNGCDYVMHVGETESFGGPYRSTVDIVCSVLNFIDITIYASASNENVTVCTIKIYTQSGRAGANIRNTLTGLEMRGSAAKIAAAKSGLCGSAETTTGELDFNIEFKGTNGEGASTSVQVSD